MPILLLILVVLIAYLWIRRSRELFVLKLSKGKLTLLRGTASRGLLAAFRDSLGDAREGSIRAHRTPYGARLSVRGQIGEACEQRLRNVLGLYPVSQLRAPAIDKRRAVDDIFRLGWLLTWLRRR